jgi:hypothetical protein
MIGKSGNGKSSTGNTLLGYKLGGFTVGGGLNAVTQECQTKTGCLVTTQIIKVVDTPGAFDEETSLGKRALEIQKAVTECPNPNAFLLVLGSGRFTEEERNTVDLMHIIFGEEIFDHMCIVFTHGSRFQDEADFKKTWNENEHVKDLVEKCNGRVFKIENSNQSQDEDENFLNIINAIKECPEYKNKHLAIHKAALEEHLHNYISDNQEIRRQLKDLIGRLNKQLKTTIWKENLKYGAAGVAMGAALGGVALKGYDYCFL